MKYKSLILALVATFVLGGCATALKDGDMNTWTKDDEFTPGGHQSVQFETNPEYAKIVITDMFRHQIIYSGQTPARLDLKLAQKYMEGKIYKIELSKPGYKNVVFELRPSVSLHYSVGNIFNLFGYVLVDPHTGDMWNLIHDEDNKCIDRTSDNVLKITMPSVDSNVTCPPPTREEEVAEEDTQE